MNSTELASLFLKSQAELANFSPSPRVVEILDGREPTSVAHEGQPIDQSVISCVYCCVIYVICST
jgi:hypothetical protein